jgi:hypothetical protein
MFRRRPDGVPAADVPGYRQMMPYLMTGKNASAVYTRFTVDMEKALAMFRSPPPGLEGKLTLTHLFLRAGVKTLAEFPDLNRYVSGRRLYQRDGIWFSFSAKKAFRDDAPIVVIKIRFDPDESLQEMVDRVVARLSEGRSDKQSVADKETKALLNLPRGVIRAAIGLQSVLDYFNLLPSAFIEHDIFYASAFIANLGSIGLDAAYHHLYEYGNIPLFITIGKVQPMAVYDSEGCVVMRPTAEVKATVDDRVADGFYGARALARLKHLMEHPDEML